MAERVSRLYVVLGLVVKVEIYFPPGSSGLMGCRIFDGGYQAFPATPGEWFLGDNLLLTYEELYDKSAAPAVFDVYTYNLDTLYSHVIQVRIVAVSKDEYIMRYNPLLQNQAMQDLLAKIQTDQAENKAETIAATVRRLSEVGA
jgi:hypothetical protein